MSEPRTEAGRQLRERHYRVVPTDPKILHPYCPGCLQDWDPEGCDTARALALLDQERASLEMCRMTSVFGSTGTLPLPPTGRPSPKGARTMPNAMVDRLAASLTEAHSHDAHTTWCAFEATGCDCGYARRYEDAERELEAYRLLTASTVERCYLRDDGTGGCSTHDSPWPIGRALCDAAHREAQP